MPLWPLTAAACIMQYDMQFSSIIFPSLLKQWPKGCIDQQPIYTKMSHLSANSEAGELTS